MTHTAQLQDPLYKNWVKGGLAIKYLKEGIEHVIDDAFIDIKQRFLSDICNHLTITEAKCTTCTTANCLPCPTKGVCSITGKGKDRKCSYHVMGDKLKEHTKCPNDICNSIHTKITSQHRNGSPVWKNIDATRWCTNHWEIAKCFLPALGYTDKSSVADTDCSGLLNLAMNCLNMQSYFDTYLEPPNGTFSEILSFRNAIFHSPSLSLSIEDLEKYIDLMISVLQDRKVLERDTYAQNAVLKLKELKDVNFCITTKDESEIRQEAIEEFKEEEKNNYVGRKEELQEFLCRIYEEHFDTIPLSPLLDDMEADIDDVFVKLILCDDAVYNENTEQTNGRKIENYHDIFYKDKNSCKNIYIIGDAGIGKSTWCMKMLRNWVSACKKIKHTSHKKHDNSHSLAQTETASAQPTDDEQDEEIIYRRKPITKKDIDTDTLKPGSTEQIDIPNPYDLNADERTISEFVIVLFVSLRHAFDDGNIRDMINNQLFQEKQQFNKLTSEVLKAEPERCLIIIDGLDEWSRPARYRPSSVLQHPCLPGRKDLNECPILTTTRPWKLNSIRLQNKEIDKTIKIQGIEDVDLLAKRVITHENKIAKQNLSSGNKSFKNFYCDVKQQLMNKTHTESPFKGLTCDFSFLDTVFNTNDSFSPSLSNVPFLKVPLLLICIICSWFDRGCIEPTWAGNFKGFLECLIIAAEKDASSRRTGRLYDMRDLDTLKTKWLKYAHCLPKCLQKSEKCSNYGLLLLKLSKLSFNSLFNRKYTTLVFTETEIKLWFTENELKVALSIGVLSQSKMVGKSLEYMSSLSFLHKSMQEYLAAVYLCSPIDEHNKTLEIYKKYCSSRKNVTDTANVVLFVIGIDLYTAIEIIKHIAEINLSETVYNDYIRITWDSEIETWKKAIKSITSSKSESYRYYGAVLSGSNSETLEITSDAILNLLNIFCKQDPACIDLKRLTTWLHQTQHLSANQLKTVQIFQISDQTYTGNQKVKIDLSHCLNLEVVSLKNLFSVQIVVNQQRLKNINLVGLRFCDVNVIQTNQNTAIQQTHFREITLRRLKQCKLSLCRAFWRIQNLCIDDWCVTCVIEIEQIHTDLAYHHIIENVVLKNVETNSIEVDIPKDKMLITNIIVVDTHVMKVDLITPFLKYSPKSFSLSGKFFQSTEIYALSCALLKINQKCRLTDIILETNVPFPVVRKMVKLERLHLIISSIPPQTTSYMPCREISYRLKDLAVSMQTYRCCKAIAKSLKYMKQLENLKLSFECIDCDLFYEMPNEYNSTSTPEVPYNVEVVELLKRSIQQINHIKFFFCEFPMNKYEEDLKKTFIPNLKKQSYISFLFGLQNAQKIKQWSSTEEIIVSAIEYLTALKILKCAFRRPEGMKALIQNLPKLVNLEKLELTFLSFYDQTDITNLMSSIQHLNQLRHFKCDLMQDTIIKALPGCLTTLKNIEELELHYLFPDEVSDNTDIDDVIHSIQFLTSLKSLKIDGITKLKLVGFSRSVPKLVNLVTLSLSHRTAMYRLIVTKNLTDSLPFNEKLRLVMFGNVIIENDVMDSDLFTTLYCLEDCWDLRKK